MDNKDTDLYLKNELIYETVKRYVENLEKVQKEVKYISTKMRATSETEWGGTGREGFETALNKWLESAYTVEKEIDVYKNIIDDLLKDSADLFKQEKNITDDME